MGKTKEEIKKINKDILILDLVEQYPDLAEILTDEYGFHCIGCMAASMETLEQGAAVHGMSDKEIEALVTDLNKRIQK
jgi:hybrid cluster-associated redox disulfide protein